MKKVQFLFLSFLALGHCYSQLNKGIWIVGGNGSFSTSTYNQTSTATRTISNFQFSPVLGYFVLPRFPVGIRAIFQIQKENYRDASGSTGTGGGKYSSVGPFIRYYFLPKSDQMVNLFVEGSYAYGLSKPDIVTNAYHFNRYSLLGGPVLYFNSSVGVEFNIGYFKEYPTDGQNPRSGFQTGLGFQIHLEKIK